VTGVALGYGYFIGSNLARRGLAFIPDFELSVRKRMSAMGQKRAFCDAKRHIRFTQIWPLKSAYQFAPKCDRRLSLDQRTLVENRRAVSVLA
jgi:hypothetical protein